jgi:hypothetical protein
MQNHWSPTARLLVGAAGSILTIQGLRQGGVLGSSLSVTGIVLLLYLIAFGGHNPHSIKGKPS